MEKPSSETRVDKASDEDIFEELEAADREFRSALDEESRILAEIDAVLASSEDRLAAERIVGEKFDSRMEAAQERSRNALRRWSELLRAL